MTESNEVDYLLSCVHERLGCGINITTFGGKEADGDSIEVYWVRDYPGGGYSDERFTIGSTLVEVLQYILDYEDTADADFMADTDDDQFDPQLELL